MYVLTLSHAPNPDIRGGYWEPTLDEGHPKKKHLTSLAACIDAARDYIDRNHLGGGNWTGGEIRKDGVVVAYVSYNRRLWNGPLPSWQDQKAMMAHRELDPATGIEIPGQEII